MMAQESLFPPPPRKRGPLERATDQTLRDWAAAGHLTGPTHAAARASLRQLARAADDAEDRMRAGNASPYTASACTTNYRNALERYQPPEAPTFDAAALELERAALAVIHGLPEHEEAAPPAELEEVDELEEVPPA